MAKPNKLPRQRTMKILITGAGGQLGHEILHMLQNKGVKAIGIGRKDVDFSQPQQVAAYIASQRADWVINCAAYTQVDKAEDDAELAFRVNRDAAKAVAEGVQSYAGRLLQVSTDFIFDGKQSHPYRENDKAAPLGIYGQSKWEGEQAVRKILPQAIILRTAWVYGAHGNNFVKTILRLASEREELGIIDEQVGNPSWTFDISQVMYALIEKDCAGIYHFSNEGAASWYDFALAIVEEAQSLGFAFKIRTVNPIPTHAYPTPAARPAYSVLSKEKIRAEINYKIPHWRESLKTMLQELRETGV
ncbi:dTDP-4-dehydrorhamnose reductase [hydrothermal vent metagenome]|uniref:dTDP-4-dehydrorhamnose reductase n=1 Tax=hydrothermal vent metagenome TaxID=652676 RepID=A0A3B1BS96_9ZZZZ